MSETRSWLPKVFFESLLIVFSILLALAVDEWRDERQAAKRAAQTLESFALEIQENQRYLARLAPYHEGLKKEFGRLGQEGGFRTAKDLGKVQGFRGFNPPAPFDDVPSSPEMAQRKPD
jgi:type II secretory pathway pseudopilin PulG